MAKFYNVPQNGVEWYKLRVGIPTASGFDKIITPKKGEYSKSAETYKYHLLAESITGHVLEFQSEAMLRGHEYEAESRLAFEALTDTDTQDGGFWTNDAGTAGASPDALIGEDGLLELKNPNAATHLGYLLDKSVATEYWVQLQGQLYICERKFVKIVSYYPELPLAIVTVERNEEFIAKLAECLTRFTTELAELKERFTTTVK